MPTHSTISPVRGLAETNTAAAARELMRAQGNFPRVVLVNDHPAVLRQVMQVLDSEFEVVAALEDGQELSTVVNELGVCDAKVT